MILKSAKITILIGEGETTIELIDDTSSTTIAMVTLTPEQLSRALGRGAYTPCKVELTGSFDRINKEMVLDTHVFEITKNERDSYYMDKKSGNMDESVLYKKALETCPDGWKPDKYFGSQNTFFSKDGKDYCRVTIRKWI